MDPSRFLPPERLQAFCRKWKIRDLHVFGSTARGQEGPASDLDLLVTFEPDARWSLLDHVRMEEELGDLTGKKVDLVTRRAVESSRNRHRSKRILDEARPFYAA